MHLLLFPLDLMPQDLHFLLDNVILPYITNEKNNWIFDEGGLQYIYTDIHALGLFFSTTEIINHIIKYTNLHTLKNRVKVQDQIHLNANSKHGYFRLPLTGSIDPSMKQAVTKIASNKNMVI